MELSAPRSPLGAEVLPSSTIPAWPRGLAATGSYDAVFYGHDHQQHKVRLQVGRREVLLANPGTLSAMGKPQTFLIYDSEGNDARFVEVDRL